VTAAERAQRAYYWTAVSFLWLTFGASHRFRALGREHVPREGAVIIASNHRHYFDPIFMGLGIPRPVAYMAKAEIFDIPILGLLSRGLYAFPVHRGAGDRAALRAAAHILADGGALGMFPEGTRQLGPALGEPQAGAAMLSLTTGAPIVPAALLGTDIARKDNPAHRPFPRVEVRFGEPIHPDKDAPDRRQEMTRLTDAMMDGIRLLGGFPA
jgi:1-acyl-sn-glycerol-3-phosphate acyltransferase